MRVHKRWKVFGTLSALFVMVACAGMNTTTEDPFEAGGENQVRVLVQNDNFYDARVYALVEGVRRHLGSVTGKTNGVFVMPLSFPQEMRLEINILAGPTCTTEGLTVDPGDTLQLQILPEPLGADFCR